MGAGYSVFSPGGTAIAVALLLVVVFATLKVLGLTTWSWWWVTSPLWGGVAAMLAIVLFLLGVGLYLDHRVAKARRNALNYRRRPY